VRTIQRTGLRWVMSSGAVIGYSVGILFCSM
jgi:hypothetical protein